MSIVISEDNVLRSSPVGRARRGRRVQRVGGADLEQSLREHLARELHDSAVQTLTGMLIEIETFKRQQYGRASVLEGLDLLQARTRDVLANLRHVVNGPRGDSGFLLRTGLEELAARANAAGTMHVQLVVDGLGRHSGPAALDAYRIVEEALRNVQRHSGASQAWIEVRETDQLCRISITDNGRGNADLDEGTNPGFGVRAMRERATMLGGTISIASKEGVGTEVSLIFPASDLQLP